MGLSDSFSKEVDRYTKEHNKVIDKLGTDKLDKKDLKRGRLDSGGWMNVFGAGLNSKDFLKLGTRTLKGDISVGERGYRQSVTNFQYTGAYGANVPHQAIFRDPGGGTEAPPAQPLPPVGAGTRTARQDARQRAIDSQRKRFGLSSTVGTTPLGVQGQGAPTGKKRLTGE